MVSLWFSATARDCQRRKMSVTEVTVRKYPWHTNNPRKHTPLAHTHTLYTSLHLLYLNHGLRPPLKLRPGWNLTPSPILARCPHHDHLDRAYLPFLTVTTMQACKHHRIPSSVEWDRLPQTHRRARMLPRQKYIDRISKAEYAGGGGRVIGKRVRVRLTSNPPSPFL